MKLTSELIKKINETVESLELEETYGEDAKMFNIVSAWGWATNPAYNPDTANNGGGYWQFAGGVVVDLNGRLVTVEVDDMSCGDFGSRRYVDISTDGFRWQFVDGTMGDASIDAPEEVADILASASGVLGIDAWALVYDARGAADLCARQEVC